MWVDIEESRTDFAAPLSGLAALVKSVEHDNAQDADASERIVQHPDPAPNPGVKE